ncbi:MAG TPA: NAD(P)H-dependent glycerol-3-phosphate dehydrogenase [Chitinophagales bacterium]|nr:NAD(P)H-dependent glycerol-3-phosphate dehydrogenase [Chitinophagales bacterium]HNE46459.1 NAD(P)H-dependent glycerol-3-phosphate dehydrogenase [Chitinophagales bacterium]HNI55049.1 NAD(P)H-dependent glycerol-3-phosphate dehydrogenase [Chitinophagales bacterium]HNJ90775.1 NAD(P)H-dependent glycerol-3-phosphate dehydrogenase [Chitinophagales bacterium]HNM09033.1 NAD(P)H-dependent glycerol-3-phosphate dehydrogenase [Chitinophagales bacterium]
MSDKTSVGVVGSGSFGTAVANLLAENSHVFLYSRRADNVVSMANARISSGQQLHPNITPTDDIGLIAKECYVIFPIVSSDGFKEVIRTMAPFLRPDHILIHGTKGLALKKKGLEKLKEKSRISNRNVLTMSQLIRRESVVVRVGSMAGPNLAREIAQEMPAATVIASRFDEVIHEGHRLLTSPRFQVYGSYDIIGVELAGVLKNILAIGSGIVSGLNLGENARALLITKGWAEIIKLSEVLGADVKSFLGLAGIGDIIATCSSPSSRNFSVGFRLAKGEKIKAIQTSMEEVAEGINTIRIANGLANFHGIHCPIIKTLYQGIFEDLNVQTGIEYLMRSRRSMDVEFL